MKPVIAWLRDVLRFPYRQFEIDASLSQDKAVVRLRAIVEPGRAFLAGFKRTNKLFAGVVSEDSFKIRRLRSYPNAYQPVAIGRVEQSSDGTKIRVVMRLSRFVQVSVLVWSSLMMFAWVAPFFWRVFSNPKVRAGFFTPVEWVGLMLACVLFALLTVAISFGVQARKAERLLGEALQATASPRIQTVIDGEPTRLPRFAKIALSVTVACAVLIIGIQSFIARSEPFHVASNFVQADSVIRSELGSVGEIALDRWKAAQIQYVGSGGGHANFALRVQGTRSKGVVFIQMRRRQGVWRVSVANLREADGRVIELQGDATDALAPESSGVPRINRTGH